MQVMDIVEVKKFVSAGVELHNELQEVYADGTVDYRDIKSSVPLAVIATKFAGVDYQKALPEVKDIDPAEFAELTAMVAAGIKAPGNAEAVLKIILSRGTKIFEGSYMAASNAKGMYADIKALVVA